jgi:hypothetical protein
MSNTSSKGGQTGSSLKNGGFRRNSKAGEKQREKSVNCGKPLSRQSLNLSVFLYGLAEFQYSSGHLSREAIRKGKSVEGAGEAGRIGESPFFGAFTGGLQAVWAGRARQGCLEPPCPNAASHRGDRGVRPVAVRDPGGRKIGFLTVDESLAIP